MMMQIIGWFISSVESKLRTIDEQFYNRMETEQLNTHAALEERMIQYQRECDTRVQAEVEEKVSAMKQNGCPIVLD